MRVRARQAPPATAPPAVRPFLGQAFVTSGKNYDVHAAAVFQGIVVMQIVDDSGYPSWRPAWLFDIIDSKMPADWICSAFQDDPVLVLGPEFVAATLEQYAAMVELAPEQVERFWNRVDRLESPHSDEQTD